MQTTTHSLRPKKVDFDKQWGVLHPTIINLVTLQPVLRKTWNDSFSDIYELCVAIPFSYSSDLYKALEEALKQHLKNKTDELKEIDDATLLKNYFNTWNTYLNGALYLHQLFGYLNKQFVKDKQKGDVTLQHRAYIHDPNTMFEIGQLCLEIWKNTLVIPIQKRLVDLILQAISDDRNGVAITDKKVIAGVIKSILQVSNGDFGLGSFVKYGTFEMTFYQQTFEQQLVDLTRKHYSNVAQTLLSTLSPSSYMEKIIEILAQEETRSKAYFNQESVVKVIGICRDVLINEHKGWLEAACPEMIAGEHTKDLRNMYLLLKPLASGTQVMTREFESHVKSKGFASIANLNGDNIPALFVENSILVFQTYSKMKSEVFEDDVDFTHAFDKALQAVINSKDSARCPKAPERLARFTDSLLRKSTKALSDRDLEKKLDEAIIIFRYLEDKDMFQKYFSKMLANRLIMTSSLSMDSEEMMITKLKQACGYEFTSKLSRMFTDIGLSKELSGKFEDFMKKNNLPVKVPMLPLILGASAWPLSMPQSTSQDKSANETKFTLPRDLQPSIDGFERFYGESHNGRKLTWLFHLSNAEVRLTYLDKLYVVNLSTHQLAILLNLQHKDSITVEAIATDTGLRNDLLTKNLASICESGILTSETQGDVQIVSLNKKFTSKRLKIKLTAPHFAKASEKAETESVAHTVAQDRKYYMECAIVRIMKTRKMLKHNELIQEVITQTRGRFQPDITFIKKTIEDLIEKLYIQRTEQTDEYQYLA